jgi:ADP-heptose:LPS heptosyltransferase
MKRLFKKIEIAFRRILIRVLGLLVRSRRPAPGLVDFRHCKFLFVRQDRIGDVLVSTPLFALLKTKYKDAIVDVLLSTNNHFVLANDPNVRKRWVYDKHILSSVRMIREIRKERYDFVIDLMDNPSATSTTICLLSGARWTVGLKKENEYAYDIVVPLLSRKETHIVDRIARLLVPFGIDPSAEDLHIRYNVGERAQKFSKGVFEENKIAPAQTIGINISAGHEVRFWGVDNFRALITLLQRKYRNQAILLLSKPAHRTLAEEIGRGFENVIVAPVTHSFDEFAGLIKNLNLLITPDTSAVHLAAAFSVPSAVLYVQSNKDLRIWDPYKSRSELLVADVDNLRSISPERVFQAVQRLKSKRQRKNTRTKTAVQARS